MKAAEDLIGELDDEEKDIIRRRRAEKSSNREKEEVERADRNVRTGAAAVRLLDIVTGKEKPRRETTEEYVRRKGL